MYVNDRDLPCFTAPTGTPCGEPGCGYATEAGRAVVDWVSGTGCGRLWATVRDWNLASRRVLEKHGFRGTGQLERDPVHGDRLLTVWKF